jgi:2-haloacid dehalogenase
LIKINVKNKNPAIVFDLGGVLLDWNPRYLYRPLFKGDGAGMERFISEV